MKRSISGVAVPSGDSRANAAVVGVAFSDPGSAAQAAQAAVMWCPSKESVTPMQGDVEVMSDWFSDPHRAHEDAARKLAKSLGLKCEEECRDDRSKMCADPVISWNDGDIDINVRTRVTSNKRLVKRVIIKVRATKVGVGGLARRYPTISIGQSVMVSCECVEKAKEK